MKKWLFPSRKARLIAVGTRHSDNPKTIYRLKLALTSRTSGSPFISIVPYEQKTTEYFLFVRIEVFTAVTMKNCVFWDLTPCGFCKNLRFGGT
jgi:hypothetical protein